MFAAMDCRMRSSAADGGDIPSVYQQVSYLENTGTAYINLNRQMFNVEKLYCYFDLMLYNTSDGNVIGARVTPSYVALRTNFCSSKFQFSDFWSSDGLYTFSFSKNIRFVFEHYVELNGLRKDSKDGAVVYQAEESGYASFSTDILYVFGIHQANGALGLSLKGRLYSVYVEVNDEIFCDLVPVIRKADGEPGMYDRAVGIFYTNAGSGSFNYGE